MVRRLFVWLQLRAGSELGSPSPHPNAAPHDVQREHHSAEQDGDDWKTIRHAGFIGPVRGICSCANSSQDFRCGGAPP
jgi:hypothetical protein